MGENNKKNIIKKLDTVLFVVMMFGILFCIEYSELDAFYPVVGVVILLALYFAVKGLLGLRNSTPAVEDEDDITKINFMHRSRAVAILIAAVVKAQGATTVEDLDKYSTKIHGCNERINNLWREYLAKDDIDVKKACDWFVSNLESLECYVTVEYMFDLAHYLYKITDLSWELLYEMMMRMNVPDEGMNYLKHKYAVYYNQEPDADEKASARRILGVTADSSVDDIHSFFYTLVKAYHPEGITDVNLKKYTDVKLQEINTAHILLTETEKN